jgi:hypothetical protein
MKTSSWIKLIGILCIVIGAQGIINDIVFIMFPEMTGIVKEELHEVSPDLIRWVMNLGYIQFIANLIYLMAGIFFLMKKSFSLRLIYLALTLSILCRIVPMLFFSQYSSIPNSNYEINIFSLIGPFIDVALLIGVYRLAKYYYRSDDESVNLFGEKLRRLLTPQLMKILTFIGLLCLFIPVLILGLWIHAFNLGDSQANSVAIFNNYFPDFLQGRYATAYLSIVLCILAIIISSINLKSSGKIWKVNIIILVFSSLLLFLNLFQMM